MNKTYAFLFLHSNNDAWFVF